MPTIRVFSFRFWKTLVAVLLFVLAAAVSSPSPARAQAPGSAAPGAALGSGQPAHGVGRLVNPRKLPRPSRKRAPAEAPYFLPPGYAQAKELAKTESLAIKAPVSQPHVISKGPRSPLKLGSKPVSPAPRHPGERPLPGQKQPIFGNGFLLDQEQFVGNQFCDVGSSCFAPPDTQVAAGNPLLFRGLRPNLH